MQISVLIPLLNEEESLPELHQWIQQVMLIRDFSSEIIFIDDGSNDNSWKQIQIIQQKNNCVKGIRFQKNFGKSQALHAGFALATGDVIMIMDADLLDSPDEIPDLY